MVGGRGLQVIRVKPTITGGAYGANDQVGGVQTLTGAAGKAGGRTKLMSLTISDAASQAAVLNVFLFRELPTMVGGDNDAFDLTDANMAKCVGHVAVAAADYKAAANNSVACVKNINLVMDSADGHLYAAVIATGTPTYASTGDLVFNYGFETE